MITARANRRRSRSGGDRYRHGASPSTQSAKTKSRSRSREAVQHVEPRPDLLPGGAGRELAHEDRRQDSGWKGNRVATPTRSSDPASAGAMPPLPPKKSELGPLRKKSRLIAPKPRLPTAQRTIARTGDREHGCEHCDPSATRLTSSRLRPRPVAFSEIAPGSISRRLFSGTRSV